MTFSHHRRQPVRYLLTVLCLPLIVAVDAAAGAPGDLLVTPTRLVFEGNRRSLEVGLVNTGQDPATYRISLENRVMTRLGSFEPAPAEASAEPFAASMLRFYPRQIELAPGESQTVRVQLRKPAGLAAGEYRAHLSFRSIPRVTPASAPDDGISINLIPVYGVSIPVIVRQGSTAAEVRVGALRLVRLPSGDPVMQIVLVRTGNRSVYGDLAVTLTTADGEKHELAHHAGIAVYVPNAEREMRLPWAPPAGIKASGGTLRAVFTDADSRALLAEKTIQLP